MFCVVETGGKQYKVSVGDCFNVEKLDANVNDNVELKVLMLVDGDKMETGNPYLTKEICSVISAKVVSSTDLGSHTLFVAEIQDAQITSNEKPITYSDYQNDIKPKNKIDSGKKIIGWRCKICGYEYMESELPADFICPICGHPAEDFEPIYAN